MAQGTTNWLSWLMWPEQNEQGLRGAGKGRGLKRDLCDSEGLALILRAVGTHHGFSVSPESGAGVRSWG